MKKENIFIMVLLVLILAILVWMNMPKESLIGTTVNVMGTAKTTIAKDLVTVTLGVTTQDKTVKDALSKNNADINKVINALKSIGVKGEDIQTSSFWINPTYDYNTQPPTRTGYSVEHDLTVTVKSDLIGDVINASANAGANAFYNLNFKVSNEDEIKNGLIDKALLDAKSKAEQIAKNIGKKVVDYKIVSYEYIGQPTATPIFGGGGGEGMGAGVPIEIGSNEIEVRVYVTFVLK
ncbi:SIMPL domain-containing protein [Caldisericum exile]|uniref:DUF541 domain-containing protein n=1 Tax=Caldisericum exile (strain DSM 21853 / NBRC 104410 / AZM16c01) TaxID=511051 RepID=A0A7U6JEF1_CALEA|nr:SIMPL domain-containing protein [Caldisericum exile]BAL80661.1 hypothetical protein CSE_05350 [Caldisericum exile AZM16c01]